MYTCSENLTQIGNASSNATCMPNLNLAESDKTEISGRILPLQLYFLGIMGGMPNYCVATTGNCYLSKGSYDPPFSSQKDSNSLKWSVY